MKKVRCEFFLIVKSMLPICSDVYFEALKIISLLNFNLH